MCYSSYQWMLTGIHIISISCMSLIPCKLPPSGIFTFIVICTHNICINMHTYKILACICENIQRRNVDFCAFIFVLKTDFYNKIPSSIKCLFWFWILCMYIWGWWSMISQIYFFVQSSCLSALKVPFCRYS